MTALQCLPCLLDLGCPALNSFALTADQNAQVLVFHSLGVFQEIVAGHAACIGAIRGHEFQHGEQKRSNLLAFLTREMVLLVQNIG
jgi:hypothetical protein